MSDQFFPTAPAYSAMYQEPATALSQSESLTISTPSAPCQIVPSEIAVLVRSQPEAYTTRLAVALDAMGISHRNENQMQNLAAEPMAIVIVDYLLCIYGSREPRAWTKLMRRIIPSDDDEQGGAMRTDWNRFIKEARKSAAEDLAK